MTFAASRVIFSSTHSFPVIFAIRNALLVAPWWIARSLQATKEEIYENHHSDAISIAGKAEEGLKLVSNSDLLRGKYTVIATVLATALLRIDHRPRGAHLVCWASLL